ncbi:hypothetical protein PTTG_25453 [Puccinia triticina 1-1 BBBD Race 1]|uniref:Uncharacterized protein n=1 Tax=Puccinia triticina (isolate 1-1 / race 1 (BBBD)) TaxID=630390 RepID=A0A180H3Z0_PUCT1|nr:hypothetical protein PTTG_25453 [Puccinia triticina 1-1 BBBD Race 1]WAR54618.1 hypothetical protein PtB15_4B235 [Puccinia triticina]
MSSKPKKFSFKKTLRPQAPPIAPSIPSEAKSTVSAEPPSENPFGLKPHSKNLFIQPPSSLSPLHILALSDLSNVVLDLRALTPHLSTLQLARIHHAAILAPPLSGSVSLTQVSHSILLLVSQQYHSTNACPEIALCIE